MRKVSSPSAHEDKPCSERHETHDPDRLVGGRVVGTGFVASVEVGGLGEDEPQRKGEDEEPRFGYEPGGTGWGAPTQSEEREQEGDREACYVSCGKPPSQSGAPTAPRGNAAATPLLPSTR